MAIADSGLIVVYYTCKSALTGGGFTACEDGAPHIPCYRVANGNRDFFINILVD